MSLVASKARFMCRNTKKSCRFPPLATSTKIFLIKTHDSHLVKKYILNLQASNVNVMFKECSSQRVITDHGHVTRAVFYFHNQ